MKRFLASQRDYWSDASFLRSVLVGLCILVVSLVINYWAGIYATENASNYVTDIILSNVSPQDLDEIFVEGAIIFWFFVFGLTFKKPQRIPFVLKSVALFVLIRSAFISLTHIGPYPTQIEIHSYILSWFSFTGDLFFSAHTGFPFLMALIFWEHKYLRVIFIVSSLIFGAAVLLSHIHYSIDVLSAFFITYTIYHIAIRFFAKDFNLFKVGRMGSV